MKKSLIIILTLAVYFMQAQNIITLNHNSLPSNGAYIKDTQGYLDKFVGTWKYTSGNEEFTLKILKAEYVKYDFYWKDKLYGGYKYVKDGIVKVDNLNFTYFTDTTNLPTNINAYANNADMQGNGLSNTYQSVSLVGSDKVGGRVVDFELEILPNTNEGQIKMKILPKEYHRFFDFDPVQGTGSGLPTNIILIKQ